MTMKEHHATRRCRIGRTLAEIAHRVLERKTRKPEISDLTRNLRRRSLPKLADA